MLWKAGSDKLAIRALIGVVEALVMLPVVFFVAFPTPTVWLWICASISVHAVYQLTLIEAYKALDFSIAYPMARGVAPVATAIAGIFLLDDVVRPIAMAGIIIVSIGLLAVSRGGSPSRSGLVAAAAAGVLTMTYTLVDAQGVRLAESSFTFIAWYFVVEGVVMMSIASAFRRNQLPRALWREGRRGVLGGLISVFGYTCALLAFRFLSIGAASALRETSVVFASLFARVFLREHVDRKRLMGISAIVIGCLLITLGL